MSIARHVAIVGSATLASRVLGFARDMAIAGLFGAGARADAFVVAFQFTNLIRRLLTEGALNAAFVPLYLRQRDAGATQAAAFAGRTIGTLAVVLTGLAVVLALVMPFVMMAFAPGFSPHGPRLTLATELARLMLPYLVLAGPVAVLMGVLNANNRFSSAALAALLFNATILIALAGAFLWRTGDSDLSARIVAGAIAIAGLCQLALVGLTVRFGPESASPLGLMPRDEAMRFGRLAIPGLIASGIPQLTMIVAVMVASGWPGAASWLYYANRLVELPLGIVGIAIGTVMTPALSHAMRGGDDELAPRTMRHGIELSLGLAFPAAIALTLLAPPIIRILFERGAFIESDSAATATILAWLAMGLPGQVLFKTLSASFFSYENTRLPMIASLVGLAVALIGSLVSLYLGRPYGIAVAIAISGWVSAAMLWRIAARRGVLRLTGADWLRLIRIALAALIMGAAVHAVARQGGLFDADAGRLSQALLLAALMAFGVALYAFCLWLLRIVRLTDLRTAFQRG